MKNIPNKLSAATFNCFTLEEVKKINEEIKKQNSVEQEPYLAAQHAHKTGKFTRIDCVPLMKLIHPWIYQCQIINKNVYGYDIYWDFHLETLNYNVYGIGGEYRWHIDATTDTTITADVKLTCLLNLSEEPYEGGEFCTINRTEEIKFDSGHGLIINPLIAHKITPVTKGERITLTYWATGPLWR